MRSLEESNSEMESSMVAAGSWGRGKGELVLNKDRVSVWEDVKVLGMDGEG